MLEEIRLPEMITKTYFNCFEQQIMVLCYYYYKEFWKLFLGQNVVINEGKMEYVEEVLKYNRFIVQNAKKHYGICLQNLDNLFELQFTGNEIYLAYLNTMYYPHTENIEERGTHCVLIYDKNNEGYIINDNYYGETSLILSKELFNKGIRKVCLVVLERMEFQNEIDEFIESFSYPTYQVVKEGYDYVRRNNMTLYKIADFLELISQISCYIEKNCVMAKALSNNNDYFNKCISFLECLADKVRKNFYEVLKCHLKYDVMPIELVYEKVENIIDVLRCEKKIKEEILSIVLFEENIGQRLQCQLKNYLKQYLEKDEYDESKSIYELHDRLSIIYLINYFEECNPFLKLEYSSFTLCETYLDFLLVVYEKLQTQLV